MWVEFTGGGVAETVDGENIRAVSFVLAILNVFFILYYYNRIFIIFLIILYVLSRCETTRLARYVTLIGSHERLRTGAAVFKRKRREDHEEALIVSPAP